MSSKTVSSLSARFRARGYRNVFAFGRREELRAAFEKELAKAESVGFGGSVTTRELQLPALAVKYGKTVYDHWEPGADKAFIRQKHLSADLFVTAVNAVTEDGIIVNADGIGNRVAASVFGPKTVLFVITANKIVPGLSQAMERIRTVATPLNARRLGESSPCATDMQCHNCMGKERLDRVFVIHEYCPAGARFVIFILNEPMGY